MSGALGFLPTVDACRSSPSLSREYGIESTSVILAGKSYIEHPCKQLQYGNTVFNLYRHPRLLISKNIDLWEKEYDYCGDNYSMVPFLDRHPCAIEAKEIYDSALQYFRSKVK